MKKKNSFYFQIILVLKSLKLYGNSHITVIIQIISHVLAYTNSCVNPVLYAFLSDNFRKAFRKVSNSLFLLVFFFFFFFVSQINHCIVVSCLLCVCMCLFKCVCWLIHVFPAHLLFRIKYKYFLNLFSTLQGNMNLFFFLQLTQRKWTPKLIQLHFCSISSIDKFN